jgi:hypothetical protein
VKAHQKRRDRNVTNAIEFERNADKSTKLTDILPLITVWAQLRVASDDNETNGEAGIRLSRD